MKMSRQNPLSIKHATSSIFIYFIYLFLFVVISTILIVIEVPYLLGLLTSAIISATSLFFALGKEFTPSQNISELKKNDQLGEDSHDLEYIKSIQQEMDLSYLPLSDYFAISVDKGIRDLLSALTTDRPYRKALSKDDAIKVIEETRRIQYIQFIKSNLETMEKLEELIRETKQLDSRLSEVESYSKAIKDLDKVMGKVEEARYRYSKELDQIELLRSANLGSND